jgi:hypothetical protein
MWGNDLVRRDARSPPQSSDVPGDVGDDVCVEYRSRHERKRRVRECRPGDGESREQQVAQQPRERADVTALEDSVLIGERGDRVGETEAKGVPRSGLEPSDNEVIEVDGDADDRPVDDDRDRGNDRADEFDRVDRDDDDAGNDERDDCVVDRINSDSPVTAHAVETLNVSPLSRQSPKATTRRSRFPRRQSRAR